MFFVVFLSGFLLWENALAADYYVRADAAGSFSVFYPIAWKHLTNEFGVLKSMPICSLSVL